MKKCKICGYKTNNFYDNNIKVVFHYCQNCEFIFKDKKFVLSEREEKKQYSKHENTIKNKGYVDFLQDFINKAVSLYIQKHFKILDYGCGPNPVLIKLLEINSENINFYDPYFYPNKNVLKKNKYDLITSSEVVEHFLNPIKEFRFLKSLLKENSFLSIRTEFHPSNLVKFKNWWYRRDLTHISFYNKNTFKEISKKLNFKIVDTNSRDFIVFKKINCP